MDSRRLHAGLGLVDAGEDTMGFVQKHLPAQVRLVRCVVRSNNCTPRC